MKWSWSCMPKQVNGTPGKTPLARSVKVRIGRSLDMLMMLRGRSKLLQGPPSSLISI